MSLIRKHGAVLQAWACLDLVPFVVDDKQSAVCAKVGCYINNNLTIIKLDDW